MDTEDPVIEPELVFANFSLPTMLPPENAWAPVTTDERDAAHYFREILHAHHEATSWPALPPRARTAMENFGGPDALALIDQDTVMLARQTYVALCTAGTEPEVAEADPNDIPEDYKMLQAGDTDAPDQP